jgi:hypothetical protein
VIIGVGTDNRLWVRRNVAGWREVPDSGSVLGTAVLPSGTIIAAGTDTNLYTRATLGARWTSVPNASGVIDVAVLPDGTIVGIGSDDNQLRSRKNLDAPWRPEPPSQPVHAVTTLRDGALLGVGLDDLLYTRPDLAESWQPIAHSGGVESVTVLGDGTILGVTSTAPHDLATRRFLHGTWETIAGSGPVRAVSTLPDGSILGVDRDHRLRHLPELISAWTPLGGDQTAMIAVTVLADGSLLGVGADRRLHTREWPTAHRDAGWRPVRGSGGVIGVAALPDGRIVGVGADGQLRVRETLHADWSEARVSRPVIAVAALPGGTLLGVGEDNRLYSRAELGTDWIALPGDPLGLAVKAVTTLTDGSILAVGADGGLYSRTDLCAAWTTVPGDIPLLAVAERPDAISTPIPTDWLLTYTSPDYASDAGDGRPWGDGTAMAARAAHRGLPWDTGCLVTPLVGGAATMDAICDVFEAAIRDAEIQGADGVPPGRRGCVNIAGWLFNPLRDLSSTQPWGGKPWNPGTTVARDRTALGLVLRMMSAGIVVRLMLWRPAMQQWKIPLNANEHWNAAAAIQDHDAAVRSAFNAPTTQFGTVLLDSRKAARTTASIRQKMITARVGDVAAAFCGGVDLAFTRRDFDLTGYETIGVGDWQSGRTAPLDTAGWPKQDPAPLGGYPAYPYTSSGEYEDELPSEVYGAGNRYWHDQHLKLEGPIVATLEQQFAERWIADGKAHVFDRGLFNYYARESNIALVTNKEAVRRGRVAALPAPAPIGPVVGSGSGVSASAGAVVQMWRTVPLRPFLTRGPFLRGEFTIMAGVAKAMARATELITIWDQYFWSTSLVGLLAHQLRVTPTLRVLIVLPPYGSGDPANELSMRKAALQGLWHDLDEEARSRVLVRDAWAPGPDVGIYVHAKAQTYDDALLVAGSADMNRRSFECDVELDCAVLHRPTVSNHLARLYAWAFGAPWTDFAEGWLTRYWRDFSQADAHAKSALVRDPFFAHVVVDPRTPNGVAMPSNGWKRREEMDPTSISGLVDIEGRVCEDAWCPDDPKAPGRLDEITHLLERCHHGDAWPFRVPAGSVPFSGG